MSMFLSPFSFCFFLYISVSFPKSTGFLNSKVKAPGKCQDFWRAEKRLRFWIRHTVKTQWFYWFVIVLVFFNTVCVAAEHYGQPIFVTQFLCKLTYILIQWLILIILLFHFRLFGICFSGSVYDRNVGENVCIGTSNLLWIIFQSIWLRCHQWFNFWGGVVSIEGRLFRLVRFKSIAFTSYI